MQLSKVTSVFTLAAVIAFHLALMPAVHEAGHCAVAWANGKNTECEIVLAHPSDTLHSGENYAKGTGSYTTFDSHLIIIPVHLTFSLGMIWLAGRRVIAAYT